MNATSDIWAAATGGAADGGGIDADDNAILDGNSVNLTIPAIAEVECGTFDTTGYGGTISDDTNSVITVNGDILIVDGTLTSHVAAKWVQAATGNIVNATAANVFGILEIGGAGITTTLTGAVYTKRAILGAGTVTGAAHTLYLLPPGNDKWNQDSDGSLAVGSLVIYLPGNYEIGAIDFSGLANDLTIYGYTVDRIATVTGDWYGAGKDIKIYNSTDTKYTKLSMGANSLTCRDVLLGATAGSDGGGQIYFGTGHHKFRNMNIQAGGDAAEDLADFESCNIQLSGTIDCTGIDTLQNTGGVVIGGTIDETDLTGQTALLHLYPAAAGTNITEVTEISPPIGGAIPGRHPNPRRVRGR